LSTLSCRSARFVAVAVATLVFAPAGEAHGPAGGGLTGYVSTVGGLVPNVLGVQARVLGGDDRLRLANLSQQTVEIQGYDGEPYLRIGPDGVFANERSPATFLSVERDPARATVPPSADAKAPPSWRKISAATSYEWHDHRIHWTGATPPPAVQQAPDEHHLIRNWRIPARADGKPFAITGFLGYVPPAGTGAGRTWWPFAVGISAAVLVAAGVGVGARRAMRQAP
jgi:hypothetical protein